MATLGVTRKMKKTSMKKPSKKVRKIPAEKFDAMADAGGNISAHLDLSTARVFAPGEEQLGLHVRVGRLVAPLLPR